MPVSQSIERRNLDSLRLGFVEKSDQVSAVLNELKRLAKRPGHLTGLWTIRELAGVEFDLADVMLTDYDLVLFLEDCIDSFDKRVWCYVRELEPDEFQEAMRIGLGKHPKLSYFHNGEWIYENAEYRCEAMRVFLKMPYVYGTWRKYRWLLFEELALHIVEYATAKKGGSTNSKPSKQL